MSAVMMRILSATGRSLVLEARWARDGEVPAPMITQNARTKEREALLARVNA
jgi:hypothetical protein